MTTTRPLRLYEVGPRDGLQNEAARVPTADKIAFVNRLGAAGLTAIEVTAFVHPARVPAMADAADVLAGIDCRPGTRYAALVPNLVGFERAAHAGVDEVAVTAAASETFSRQNVNRSIETALAAGVDIAARARAGGLRVRAYLSTAFGCPFEGRVDPGRVVTLVQRLTGAGIAEVAVSDTIGVAHPEQVRRLLERLLTVVSPASIALHFHDTHGMAVANVLAAIELGITTFDASAGGLGGCPFAPGAAGNVATDDLLYLLTGLGMETGIDADRLADASLPLEPILAHALPSRSLQAIVAARRRAAPSPPAS